MPRSCRLYRSQLASAERAGIEALRAPPPTSKIVPWCSTVTSVRTVQLGVVFADGSERKELARLDSHW